MYSNSMTAHNNSTKKATIMNELIEIIGTLGFPIAIVIYLLYERNTTTKEFMDTIKSLHHEVSELRVSILLLSERIKS